jgi:hypothetical protein
MSRQEAAPPPTDLLARLPDALTVDQVARLLRVTRTSAASAVIDGVLPHRLAGGRLLVPTRELLRQFGVAEEGAS